MRNFKLTLLLVIFVTYRGSWAEECDEDEVSEIEECNDTEYTSYMDCVRRRTKRQTGCSESCDQCDCNSCNTGRCNSGCNVCCANFEQPCETKYCCYKTCHSQCSNQGCRDSCRRTCTEKLTDTKQTVIYQRTTNQEAPQAPNITTIINLHNKINTTNIIDVPINLKTDNINNITINTNDFGSNETSARCCQIVSPRQCTPTPTYPFMRCYHLRKRVCGNICRANIMHAQPHQVCDQRESGPPECHNQVIYIPQPQPRCGYKSEWPYVSCNIPTANCEGCYEHYVRNVERPAHCPSSCYGDGYGVGPYYNQAPVYRPNYATPSCVQLGTCPPQYPGYGYLPPSGGGVADGSLLNPIPFSSMGGNPSAYENSFVIQRDAEVSDDLSKLIFPNPTQNDDYDVQTLSITNSITQSPSTLVEPTLVKIETVNATDVLMTIKEMNDEGVEDDDLTTQQPANLGAREGFANMLSPLSSGNPSVYSGYAGDASVRYQRDHEKTKSDGVDNVDVMMADEGFKEELVINKEVDTTTKSPKSKPIYTNNPAKLAA